jgi:outer membrane protein OmpA-like peptidoglycan-associated protein
VETDTEAPETPPAPATAELPTPQPNEPQDSAQQSYDELSEQERKLLLRLRERDLSAHVSVRGTVVMLPDTLFAFGGAQLTAEGRRRVETLAETVVREAPNQRVHVEGHTDSIGAELFNQGLSERRAESVARALVDAGIEESLVDHRGYGATFPIAPNSNPDGSDNPPGRTRNRRVEVVITEE